MWHSNAPWVGTGYGSQSRLTVKHLRDAGHDPAISAFYGLDGAILNWEDTVVYPAGADAYGNDIVLDHARDHFGGDLRAGLLITLVDVWVLAPDILKQAHTACWTPVDHDPAPPRVVDFFRKSGCWPIAMSRFGERALAAHDLAPLYVPHAVDTELFQPVDRAEARDTVGLPEDAFVVGMVAANKGFPPRKGFPEAIAAFARLLATHDDAFLYLHTEPHGVANGVNIPQILAHYKVPTGRVRFVDPYRNRVGIPVKTMPHVFSAIDVLLNPSYGEGFGIPLLEAQACGTPVIATDCTAMSELASAGWLVGGQEQWSEQNTVRVVPSVERLVWALGEAHTRAHRLAGPAREFALGYDIRRVMEEHWLPVLAELERRMAPIEIDAVPAEEAVAA